MLIRVGEMLSLIVSIVVKKQIVVVKTKNHIKKTTYATHTTQTTSMRAKHAMLHLLYELYKLFLIQKI